MAPPLHTVVETPTFLRAADRAGVTEEERRAIVDMVASDPAQGDEVQGSAGVRKTRFAGRGKGKSGGYRVMVAFLGEDKPAYLLGLLSKGDRANFDRQEIAAMRNVVTALKHVWRGRTTT